MLAAFITPYFERTIDGGKRHDNFPIIHDDREPFGAHVVDIDRLDLT